MRLYRRGASAGRGRVSHNAAVSQSSARTGPGLRRPSPRAVADRDAEPSDGPALALAGFCCALYTVLSLARLHRMANPSWDLAIFEQAVRGYAWLGAPTVDIKGPGFHQLGDHFSPLLVVLAPFYRAFPGPATLLIAQAVLIAFSVAVIARAARRILGPRSGLALGLAYGISWGVQSAVDVQFHEYSLAVPLLALGLVAYLEGRWRASAIWIVLLLGVKEDLGLTVAAFGVLLWLRGQRRLGAWVAAVGVAGMVLILTVIIPAFNPEGRYDYWGRLDEDESSGGGLWSWIVDVVGVPVKWQTILLLLLITAFAAVRSSLVLLVLPTLAWRFVGSVEYYWGSTWHYSVILMPIVFAAAIEGLSSANFSWYRSVRRYATAAPVLMVVIALALCPRYPFADLVDSETYAPAPRADAAREVMDLIPAGASVATDTGLIVQLAADRTVYWIGAEPAARPEFVLVDARAGWGGNPPADAAEFAQGRFPGASYELVYDQDGYQLARRGSAGQG